MKDKICKVCQVKKSQNEFSPKQAVCKPCRTLQATTQNQNNRMEERKQQRIKLREACNDMTDEKFDESFLKEELLPYMKTQTDLFSFCEVPRDLKEIFARDELYQKGYLLRPMFFTNVKKREAGIIHIM